ncbi:hypothetical protein [Snodgrassella alvi]|uniref:hypothetical protein n=1 Tax=Snodgrassella alvi TaxID=1196083 RepID=UPI000C1E7CF8|nr:hypothetical protein [Snodgrassella alvi]PIT44011.1 hypothetical protein BHC51_10270 [Snodgrassella alvi]
MAAAFFGLDMADVAGGIVLILYAIAIGLFLFYQLVSPVVAVFNIIAQCFGFFDQVASLVVNKKNLTKKIFNNQSIIKDFNRIFIQMILNLIYYHMKFITYFVILSIV